MVVGGHLLDSEETRGIVLGARTLHTTLKVEKGRNLGEKERKGTERHVFD